MTFVDYGIVAVLGYAVVFAGLIPLMILMIAIGKFFSAKAKKAEEVPVAEVQPAPAAAAPGAAGSLKTYNVPPKTCAMLMAIVADKLGKPLNELRFISIKEVEK